MGKLFTYLGRRFSNSLEASRDSDIIYRKEQGEADRRRYEDDRRRDAEIQERECREMEYYRDDHRW